MSVATSLTNFSAGVGRTGTFIALDIMKQRMKQEKKINIFDLVKQLRSQRMKMVQTVEQYVFLYTSALRLADAIRKPQGKELCRGRFIVERIRLVSGQGLRISLNLKAFL